MRLSEIFLVRLSEFFTAAVLLLTAYLVFCKAVRNGVDAYCRRREGFFSPRLVLFLCQESGDQLISDLSPRRPGDRAVLLKLLLEGAENVSGEMTARLVDVFERYGFVRDAIRRLRSPRWWIRAEAAYQLGVMKSSTAVPALEEALQGSTVSVSTMASRALAGIQGMNAFPAIITHVKDASRWASHDMADILIAMGPDICAPLSERLETLSIEGQRMAIDILGYFHKPEMGASLLRFVNSPDLEIRARSVKALGAIGDLTALPQLLIRLEDAAWQVRLLTCIALGTLEDPSTVPDLVRRLRDRKLRVRVAAAQTLLRLGAEGKEALQEECRFSKGPTREWLRNFLVGFMLLLGFSSIPPSAEAALVQEGRTSITWQDWIPPAVLQLSARAMDYPAARLVKRGVLGWLAYRRQNHLPAILRNFLYFYDHTVIVYFALLNMSYVVLFFISYFSITQHLRRARVPFSRGLLHSPMVPPISVLVPAYNEEGVIVESVRSFLTLRYRQYEVIVINDGSKDRTLQRLQTAFELQYVKKPNPGYLPCAGIRGVYESPLYPNLIVIDKANGGKSDALNAGVNYSRYPLFCTVDADSILEPEALLRVVKPFTQDPLMVAVGGVVRIANGNKIRGGSMEHIRLPTRILPLIQIVEYMRAFFSGRMGWSALDSLLLISGAFGLFHKDTAIRCGGYRTDTVGEDMDLVVRMHRTLREEGIPYKMLFIPDPICWTEAPEDLKILASQRNRWQRGLAQTLVTHAVMLFNPRYGVVGLVAYPYYVFFELLGPIIELGGYLAMTLSILLLPIDLRFVELFFLAAILFGALLSVGAVLLEEMSFHRYPRVRHLLTLVVVAFFENFGYRQINAWWRFKGLFQAFDKKLTWGVMTRKGFEGTA